MLTPDEAANRLCPNARLFGDSPTITPGCRGPICMAWSWEPVTTLHPLWKPAVVAKAEELAEKAPFAKAAAWVAENKTALGMVPERGCCGLAK